MSGNLAQVQKLRYLVDQSEGILYFQKNIKFIEKKFKKKFIGTKFFIFLRKLKIFRFCKPYTCPFPDVRFDGPDVGRELYKYEF